MKNSNTYQSSKWFYIWYVRVSSYEQAERNVSIPSQIDQINQYAQKNWIQLYKIYQEEHSAYKWKRNVFDEMIKDIKNNNWMWWWLIVFKIDRISRSADDFLRIEKILQDKDMELISISEPMMSNYLGRYMMRDMQNRAILYSEELSFRVRLWMRKKLQMWGSLWWSTPFWFTYINDRYERDDTKAHIVKYVFNTYAEWKKWYREIAKDVRMLFWLKKYTHRKVDFTLQNTLYCWFKSKIWKLSNEEYMIRGYDKPWTYTEEYPLNYITPIITRELYDTCMQIRIWRSKNNKVKELQEELFRSVLKCTCGRNLRRDDKKWKKYLRCRNNDSITYEKCEQRKCIKLELLQVYLEWVIDQIIPWKSKLENTLSRTRVMMQESENEILNKKASLEAMEMEFKNKLSEITMSYIQNKISKDIFELSSDTINNALDDSKRRIEIIEDYKNHQEQLHKVEKFLIWVIDIRNELDDYNLTKLEKNITKSSPHYWVLFSTMANCVVDAQSISNYELFEEFGILCNWLNGYVAEPTRLELATSAVTVLRSNQLNYGSTKITKELQTE